MMTVLSELGALRPCAGGAQGVALPPAVVPLVGVLRQTAALLESLTDEQYARKPVGVVPSSIGGHVRHCLDHIDALLRGAGDGLLDYDCRERGTDVERSRAAALETIRRQECQLLDFPWPLGHRPLHLSVLVSPDAPPSVVLSSLDRELAFALSHTIHHGALIAVMAKLLGVAVPPDFGYAPSTLAHGRRAACVR
jgi:uncharacterized damage-inducible protein DinB